MGDASSISSITTAPTSEPTSSPTNSGYVMVEETTTVVVLNAEITMLGVTAAQARTPVLGKALEDGFAKSIGIPGSVTLIAIGESIAAGVPATTTTTTTTTATTRSRIRRRLRREKQRVLTATTWSTVLTFEVDTNIAPGDDAGVSALKTRLEQVTSSGGSLMAFIKTEAASLGVLTSELGAIPDSTVLTLIVQTGTKTKIIEVQRLGTSVPSTAPTTPPTYRHTAISGEITDETTSTSDGFSDGTIAGIVIGLMFSFGLIWMAMNGLQTRPSNLKGRFLRTPPSEIAMKPGAPLNPGKVHPSVVFQKENPFFA